MLEGQQDHLINAIETTYAISAARKQNLTATSNEPTQQSIIKDEPSLAFAEPEKIQLRGLAQQSQLHFVVR